MLYRQTLPYLHTRVLAQIFRMPKRQSLLFRLSDKTVTRNLELSELLIRIKGIGLFTTSIEAFSEDKLRQVKRRGNVLFNKTLLFMLILFVEHCAQFNLEIYLISFGFGVRS